MLWERNIVFAEQSGKSHLFTGLQVLTMVTIKNMVLWVMTLCSLVEVHPCFTGKVSLPSSGSKGKTSKKDAPFAASSLLSLLFHLEYGGKTSI
jgi:hypothetical protein